MEMNVTQKYLRKVAATAFVLERKEAAPNPARIRRLLALLGLSGATAAFAAKNSPAEMGQYWNETGDDLMSKLNPEENYVPKDVYQYSGVDPETEIDALIKELSPVTESNRKGAAVDPARIRRLLALLGLSGATAAFAAKNSPAEMGQYWNETGDDLDAFVDKFKG